VKIGALRTLRIGLIAAALSSSAATCDDQPIVRLGQLPTTVPPTTAGTTAPPTSLPTAAPDSGPAAAASGSAAPVAGAPLAGAPSAGNSGSYAGHDESRECEEYDPVCGTDNKNYPNACAAILAGVGVARRGSC
jgi:hypothetical protein